MDRFFGRRVSVESIPIGEFGEARGDRIVPSRILLGGVGIQTLDLDVLKPAGQTTMLLAD